LAKLLVSTPEPEPNDEIRDCAADFAAALPVTALVAGLWVEDETLVTMVWAGWLKDEIQKIRIEQR
jgi:hypothetical protein